MTEADIAAFFAGPFVTAYAAAEQQFSGLLATMKADGEIDPNEEAALAPIRDALQRLREISAEYGQARTELDQLRLELVGRQQMIDAHRERIDELVAEEARQSADLLPGELIDLGISGWQAELERLQAEYAQVEGREAGLIERINKSFERAVEGVSAAVA